jgi:16S rRNA (cytosine967-C5)-methyltransferase
MVSGDLKTVPSGWVAAAGIVARWLDRRERVDGLMDGLPVSLSVAERARCQNLVFGVMRHAGRLEAALGRIVAHPPRFATRAVLYLAGFELIEAGAEPGDPGRPARIVHHAVEQAKARTSPAEARLVNAVARKLAIAVGGSVAPREDAPAGILAEYYSHPDWLVRRWLSQFGAKSTRSLLEWNQQPAPLHARSRTRDLVPSFLKPTPWPGFYEVPSGHWNDVEPLLRSGSIYMQDPAARLPVELLGPKPDETILDACAAPGGKSLLIADAMSSFADASADPSKRGRLVALDLPGERIERLRENLAHVRGVAVEVVPGDVRRAQASAYSAVLIDVPCTNTGVMRHRVDVKWRLQEGDFRQHARQQLTLLAAAARLVAPGGRLVYSTCSIDREENQDVVDAFLNGAGAVFRQGECRISYPWEAGHDGGAAFLLTKGRGVAPPIFT